MFSSFVLFSLLVSVFSSYVSAAAFLHKRCTNGPQDRSCWGDYDISTNYYNEYPTTGVTREYWFNIVNITAAPDGVERMVLSVNGLIPGPTIIAYVHIISTSPEKRGLLLTTVSVTGVISSVRL